MGDVASKTIALYVTVSDEFLSEYRAKHTKYNLNISLKRDIIFALYKYAYRRYFKIKVDSKTVKSLINTRGYDGKYHSFSFDSSAIAVAVSENPIAIDVVSGRADVDEKEMAKSSLSRREYKAYEESGYSPDILYTTLGKKHAMRKLYEIKSPSGNRFDYPFVKDIDPSNEQFYTYTFEYENKKHYIVSTAETELVHYDIKKILNKK